MIWNLSEYRERRRMRRPADRMPWLARLGPGLYALKDGSLLRLFGFRGLDPADMTEAAAWRAAERLNETIRRMGAGWAAWIEAANLRAEPPEELAPEACPDSASWLLAQDQRAAFLAGNRRELRQFLALQWLPPADARGKLDRGLIEGGGLYGYREHVATFVRETDALAAILRSGVAEIAPLDERAGDSWLSLAATLDPRPVRLGLPLHISEQVGIAAWSGGFKPRLGRYAVRTVNVYGWPEATGAGMLSDLTALGIEFRAVARWIALSDQDARSRLSAIWRRHAVHRKSLASYLLEILTKEESATLDPEGVARSDDAQDAMGDRAAGNVAFGYATLTVTVWDDDARAADEKAEAVEAALRRRDFTAAEEQWGAQEAWLGSLPGHAYANVARYLVKSRNLAHAAPQAAPWTGPDDGPPLLLGATPGGAPWRLRLHIDDVGHTLVAGPSGTGKSVLLAALGLAWGAHYGADGQVIICDVGRSARITSLAAGGDIRDLGSREMCFQPLADVDDPSERAGAFTWLREFIADRAVTVTPGIEDQIDQALGLIASTPRSERTMTVFRSYLAPGAAKDALRPFCAGGDFAHVFDGDASPDLRARWLCLEMQPLMDADMRPALGPALSHLLRLIERRLDGRPTLILLDEAWRFLADSAFGPRIGTWLRELRKKGGSVVLATQALADVLRSPLAPVVLDNCPTRLLLPNERAEESAADYAAIGLTAEKTAVVATAIRRRQYVYDSPRGFGVFSLDLSDLGLALCAASAEADHRLADRILNSDPARFLTRWLDAKGVGWAANLIADFDQETHRHAAE